MQTCGQPMHNIINYIIFSFYLFILEPSGHLLIRNLNYYSRSLLASSRVKVSLQVHTSYYTMHTS